MASASSNWYDASVEDGNLYARAFAEGANDVVLATKDRTTTFLATKEGKYPSYQFLSIYHKFPL